MWSGRAKDIFLKLEPVANRMGLKIVEMDLPTGMNGVFRIYLDTIAEGTSISIDECSKFTPVVSDFLDAEDMFNFRYYLEVSSPGLDRPVRRWEDLHTAIGKTVKIKFTEPVQGRKKATGTIISVSDEKNEFELETDGIKLTVAKGFVKKINIVWNGDK